MITRAMIFGGVLMLSSACATATHYRNALHPQYGQTEFDRDVYECRRENTHPKASSVALPNVGTSEAGMVVDEGMARSCLAARGWRPAAPPAGDSPTRAAEPQRSATGPPIASTSRPDASVERSRTERFQRWAREQLAKPYTQAPFACSDDGWMSSKNYVVDVAPWAEAAGLRKGDRMVAFGEISLAQYDAGEAWSKAARGGGVAVRVERAGHEMSIALPCRDDAEGWTARVGVWRAVADAHWQACIDALRAYSKVTRMAPASVLRVAWECMRERGKAAAQRLPDEYWRTFHAWATKAIEESRHTPTGLAEIRTSLLDAADVLEREAGRPALANDIRQASVASRKKRGT